MDATTRQELLDGVRDAQSFSRLIDRRVVEALARQIKVQQQREAPKGVLRA